ncbi:NepR family anti-sigma factor [Tropicibacter oceani]|uniref:NepR family anti-sigma factor n=1 Tax=Tropicibacter oceani TaxID=3058420 RepID=A0ABY8QM97_9RHOB|nr:NepR family anti-sigma factor [Tropicibacter oceani]WGW05578.1 NepR family anti-sigma factor [Tropicibacter oceani]
MTRENRDSRLQQEIEANLKRAYDDVLKQDVPDRFTQLLAQLQQADGAKKDGDQHDV